MKLRQARHNRAVQKRCPKHFTKLLLMWFNLIFFFCCCYCCALVWFLLFKNLSCYSLSLSLSLPSIDAALLLRLSSCNVRYGWEFKIQYIYVFCFMCVAAAVVVECVNVLKMYLIRQCWKLIESVILCQQQQPYNARICVISLKIRITSMFARHIVVRLQHG